jgi:hypothetical protein
VAIEVSVSAGLFPWKDLAEECREDPGIWTFVAWESSRVDEARQLADWDAVLSESQSDRAFAEAVALKSYARFAALANATLQAADRLTELTDAFNWRSVGKFCLGIPGILLIIATLGIAIVDGDFLVFAGQLAAIVFAPVAGLEWRGGARRHNALSLVAAAVVAIVGLGALVAPLVIVHSRNVVLPYWSSLVILTIFMPTMFVFALDHSNRPLLRDVKTLLLSPGDYGLDRQASSAREAWLHDARDEAVSHELTQAINRLLAPEYEKRILVKNASGLRAIYHEESQVPTRAARRVESAMERSDGASIALSGPRGSGKTNLLTELSKAESRLSVLVSAPTHYAPREFLIQLFQELCRKCIGDRLGQSKVDPWRKRILPALLTDDKKPALRVLMTLVLAGLLIVDLASSAASKYVDRFPAWLLGDRSALYAAALCVLIVIIIPKQFGERRRDTKLVAVAKRYLAELRAEETATTQVQASFSVMQATRSKASRSLPWTMPELVGNLRDFLSQMVDAELRGANRQVLICIDELDRIGSAVDATNFISEIKAVFGAPRCYFVVAIADELGIELSKPALANSPISDNAFDEIISVEPMTYGMCRDLLTRRVLGFTESFVWLSLVFSGGLPRELIRVARRIVEMAIESDYELRLAGCAEELVRSEICQAILGSRLQLIDMSAAGSLADLLDELTAQSQAFESGVTSGQLRGTLVKLLRLLRDQQDGGQEEVKLLAGSLAVFVLLGITICDAFADAFFAITALRNPTTGLAEIYEELAVARREFSLSSESCRISVEQIRKGLRLPEC